MGEAPGLSPQNTRNGNGIAHESCVFGIKMDGILQTEPAVAYGLMVLAVLSLVAVGSAAVLGGLKRNSSFFRSLAFAVGLTGCSGAAGALMFLDPGRAGQWHAVAMFGQLLLPAALLSVCISLMDPSQVPLIRAARWRVRAMGVVGGVLACAVAGITSAGGGAVWGLLTAPAAVRVAMSFLVIALVLDLAYIEQSLRLLRDPIRYRLKYILLGLGAVAGVQIYHVSQRLSVPVEEAPAVLLSGFGGLMAMGLIAVGLWRTSLRESRPSLYVAPGVVYGSVTFVVIGLYLIAVGVVGEIIRYSGLPLREVLRGLAMLAGVMAILVMAVSRSVRVRVRRWIARLVYRAKYDYRAKWLEVTEAFQDCHTTDAVLDRFLDILTRTFGAPRISVWLRFESDGRFHLVRSTVPDVGVPPLPDDHWVVTCLRRSGDVLEVDLPGVSDGQGDNRFWSLTQAEWCIPIRSSGELLGFIAVGRDERGERYDSDDGLLLRAIAHHVGTLLALSRQMEERRAAAGLEALHRFSAFCLHDLKNLTAGLSLLVQNAAVHGHDPAFQRSVMNTVTATVRKMTALMDKLSLRGRSETPWQVVDLGAMIRETVESMNIPVLVDLQAFDGRPAAVRAMREELQQVLLNLLLNAQQAGGAHGTVSICAEIDGRTARVEVVDHGSGIPADRLRTLFQPFQTTKPGGLGIGLYQCKQIVEAHGGTIQIRSEEGKGTRVTIELPLAPIADHAAVEMKR